MASVTADPARELTLYFRINRDGRLILYFLDENGDPFDLTDYSAVVNFKSRKDASDNILQLTDGDGLTIDAVTDTIELAITKDQAAQFREQTYFWELVITDPDSLEADWLTGDCIFHNGKFDGVATSLETITVNAGADTVQITVLSSSQAQAASQAEVNAETITSKYVSPGTIGAWLTTKLATIWAYIYDLIQIYFFKIYSVRYYGAIADNLTYLDGAVVGTAATSALATFTSADVGKAYKIAEAGTAGAEHLTTIAAFISAHAVTLTDAAPTSVSGKRFSYGTDNTEAFQDAHDAAWAAGAGVVYILSGSYAFAGPFITSDADGLNPNSMIYVRATPLSAAAGTASPKSIKFLGEVNFFSPVSTEGVIGGVVLHCYRNQGTGTRPTFFGGKGKTSDVYITGMSYTTVSFENITFIHASNGGVTPTNMVTVNMLDLATTPFKNVCIAIEGNIYSPVMTNPFGIGGVGLIVGRRDNNGPNNLQSVWIGGVGYEYGAILGEHTYPDGLYTSGCYNGITFLNGNFSVVGKICTNFHVNHIVFPNGVLVSEAAGSAFVNLDWDFETSGVNNPPGWLFFTQFILDAGQNGRGKIRYNYQNGQETFTNLTGNSTNYGLITVPLTRPEIFTRSISKGYEFDLPIVTTQFKLSALNTPPANAGDTGTEGEVRIDANFIYVCIATNTWRRSAISTW